MNQNSCHHHQLYTLRMPVYFDNNSFFTLPSTCTGFYSYRCFNPLSFPLRVKLFSANSSVVFALSWTETPLTLSKGKIAPCFPCSLSNHPPETGVKSSRVAVSIFIAPTLPPSESEAAAQSVADVMLILSRASATSRVAAARTDGESATPALANTPLIIAPAAM